MYKSLIAILLLLCFSCKEEYIHDPLQVINNQYTNLSYKVKLETESRLSWTIEHFHGEPMIYTLPYTTQGNTVRFEVTDTIIRYYKDPITGEQEFIESHYHDRFEGYFKSADLLLGNKVIHSYEDYLNGKIVTNNGIVTIRHTELHR